MSKVTARNSYRFNLGNKGAGSVAVGDMNLPEINCFDLTGIVVHYVVVDGWVGLRIVAEEHKLMIGEGFQNPGDPVELGVVLALPRFQELRQAFELTEQIHPIGQFIALGKRDDIVV